MGTLSNAAILVDGQGRPVTSQPTTALATGTLAQTSVLVSGSDYAATPNAQTPKVDASGNQYVLTAQNGPNGATGANVLRTPVLNSSSQSLIVNGATTNVAFTWVPSTTTASYIITGINFVISSYSVIMQGKYWMALSGGLTNGILVQVSSGGVFSTLATLKINEDFLSFSGIPTINLSGSTDYIQARLSFSQPIAANSGDGVRITVRDNLTTNTGGGLLSAGTANLYYASAYVEGIRLTA